MDHSLGESQNYHRPTEQESLDDYLHAVNNLTINEENRLKMKVEILESEKTDYKRLEAKLDAFQSSTKLISSGIRAKIGKNESLHRRGD